MNTNMTMFKMVFKTLWVLVLRIIIIIIIIIIIF